MDKNLHTYLDKLKEKTNSTELFTVDELITHLEYNSDKSCTRTHSELPGKTVGKLAGLFKHKWRLNMFILTSALLIVTAFFVNIQTGENSDAQIENKKSIQIEHNSFDEEKSEIKKQIPTLEKSNKVETSMVCNTTVNKLEEEAEKSNFPNRENIIETGLTPLNEIILNDEELKKLKITRGFFDRDNNPVPNISYYDIESENMNFWTMSKNSMKWDNIENINKDEMISPVIITMFNGRKKADNSRKTEIDSDMAEFIPFYNEFKKFIGLRFIEDNIFESIPKNIERKIHETSNMLDDYTPQIESPTSAKIRVNLNQIYEFFHPHSSYKEDQYLKDNYDLVLFDSRSSESEEDKEYVQEMLEKGIKIKFEKSRITLINKIQELFAEQGQTIAKFDRQMKNFIMTNKLVAVKIPYKGQQDDGMIFWFEPSDKLLELLPERYREQLRKEFEILKNPEAICAAPIDKDNAYMDVFRACSDDIKNLKLFPNPVRNNLSVSFELEDNSKTITCAIYNTAGEQVKALLVKQQFTLGKNLLTFDVSDLQSNMYLFTIKSGKDRAVLRFIKE